MNTETVTSIASTPDTAIGINMILAVWIVFSPFLLIYRQVHPAVLNSVAVGVLLAVFSGIRVSIGYRQPGWSWCTAPLGLWLSCSPFVLGFANPPIARWNNIAAGALVSFLSWRGAVITVPEGEATPSALSRSEPQTS